MKVPLYWASPVVNFLAAAHVEICQTSDLHKCSSCRLQQQHAVVAFACQRLNHLR